MVEHDLGRTGEEGLDRVYPDTGIWGAGLLAHTAVLENAGRQPVGHL
jgi:hypothetical protein